MRTLLEQPIIREALFLASPSLTDSMPAWEAAPESERGRKVEPALVRYLSRMMTRATPFGLFAGCSLGRLGDKTHLDLGGGGAPIRRTRLDMDYLCSLTSAVAGDPDVAEALCYRPNDTLYRVAGRLRYLEVRLRDKRRTHHVVELEPSELLETALDRAATGVRPGALAAALHALDPDDLTEDDARHFVQEMIDAQVLVALLTPVVTGTDAVDELIVQLAALPTIGARAATCLAGARAALVEIDRSSTGVEPDRYRAIATRLATLPCAVELSRLFQVDLVRPAPRAELSVTIADELLAAAQLLRGFASGAPPSPLAAFAAAFEERYGDREVALTEALDDEVGIGFGDEGGRSERAPLLDGLHLTPSAPKAASFGPRQELLFERLEQLWSMGGTELALSDADVARLSGPPVAPEPDAFSVIATLAASSAEAVAGGDYRLLFGGAFGPSGMRLLGRFCHVDPALAAYARAHLRAEEALHPELVFAEIVHLPEGRLGNLICRPVLRQHEISFLGRSSAETPLRLGDLFLSVRDGRIRLRSARLDREIAPRLTSAINVRHEKSVSLHYFLAALESQGVAPAGAWGWGALSRARFLPRVTRGRIVLARAQWRLDEHELRELATRRGAARFAAARSLADARRMPRLVRLLDGDNELTVDWDNPLLVDAFVELAAQRTSCTLAEMFPGPDELVCEGPGGRFAHELVVSYVRSSSPLAIAAPPRAPAPRASWLPGGDCLYLKVYGGGVSREAALTRSLAPLIREAVELGTCDRWFFIRYDDPHPHLRLRFFGRRDVLYAQLLPRLHDACAPLLASGQIWKLQLDTYEPEAERYGGPVGLALAEQLFHVESEAVLAILELLDGDEGENTRWQVALLGIDMLLDNLGFAFDERRGLVGRLRATFGQELLVDTTPLKHDLGRGFRARREAIDALFDDSHDEDSELWPFLEILRELSVARRSASCALREAERAGQLTRPLHELTQSLVHMFLNRVLRSSARAQELVLYDHLCRVYDARAARQPR